MEIPQEFSYGFKGFSQTLSERYYIRIEHCSDIIMSQAYKPPATPFVEFLKYIFNPFFLLAIIDAGRTLKCNGQ